jgi:hypothetical protein
MINFIKSLFGFGETDAKVEVKETAPVAKKAPAKKTTTKKAPAKKPATKKAPAKRGRPAKKKD